MDLYLFNVGLHVLAAILWLGGMFFLAAVGAPILRKVEPPELRAVLFQKIGVQFRLVGWICIGVLLVTGIGNLYFRHLLSWTALGSGAFWSGPFGRTLAWKLIAVTVMLVVQALHDFVLGPRAGRLRGGSPEALSARRRAAWIARANALLGIVVVLLAVALARGG